MPESNGTGTIAPRKPGTSRDATLYRALNGVGANRDSGASLTELRDRARSAFERLELPVWRRSGF